MSKIPAGQQFHTLASSVNTIERGSALVNSERSMYTMQDLSDSLIGFARGTGTLNKIPVWSSTDTVIDSVISQNTDGDGITVVGTINIGDLNVAPESAEATGVTGEIRYTEAEGRSHIYLCTNTDTWVRVELSTWE